MLMDRLRQDLLADAGLAENEDAHFALRDVADERADAFGDRIDDAQCLVRPSVERMCARRRTNDDEGEATDLEACARRKRFTRPGLEAPPTDACTVLRSEVLDGVRRAEPQEHVAARQRAM